MTQRYFVFSPLLLFNSHDVAENVRNLAISEIHILPSQYQKLPALPVMPRQYQNNNEFSSIYLLKLLNKQNHEKCTRVKVHLRSPNLIPVQNCK